MKKIEKNYFTSKINEHCPKNEVYIKDFYSKCDQIRSFLRIWSHLQKKFLMKNFIICGVKYALK